MKAIIVGMTFVVALSAGINAWASGYIESQMNYQVKADGTKAFEARWDEDDLTMFIDMELEWQNYQPDWHAAGFHLSESYTARVAFPQLAQCGLAQFKGEFLGDQDKSHNKVSLIFKGPDCRYLKDDFSLYGVSLVFYEVPSWSGSKPVSPVVRVQIFDQIH